MEQSTDRLWANVAFHFYGDPTTSYQNVTAYGEVRAHKGGMVLSLEWDDGPYVITGQRATAGAFTGRHHGLPDDVEVRAAWNSVGDRHVGSWHEAGEFYLFTLVLEGWSRWVKETSEQLPV